jgi:DNA-directed RNA polymerase subunit omega
MLHTLIKRHAEVRSCACLPNRSDHNADFFVFAIALGLSAAIIPRSIRLAKDNLNAELTRKALEKVGNPNVLVNLISRRVRQLNSGSGAMSRPLVEPGNMGAADIALAEIIEEKIGFEMPEVTELTRPTAKRRKKH